MLYCKSEYRVSMGTDRGLDYMNKKALHVLEYAKMIDRLVSLAHSAPGKRLCRELLPSVELSAIQQAQRETTDAAARIRTKGHPGFGALRDIRPSLVRLNVGASLSLSELSQIASLLESAEQNRSYGFHEEEEALPDSLEEYFASLDPLPSVLRELRRCILSENEISDHASPELHQLRKQLGAMDERMRNELNAALNQYRSCLMEQVVTMRDGSYCLAVKSEFKNKVQGMIHDQSATGSTIFIEPLAAIRINNERRELELREQREISEILRRLSLLLAPEATHLEANLTLLAHLDFVFAKAKLSQQMEGSEPAFNTDGILEIKDARHPLIPKEQVVPISIRLGDGFDLLIVTGPNTGGKTVSLKTVGLFTLMGQAGLHIPAFQGSRLAVFRNVFADIGDEQSIEQSLSTFSGHMKQVVEILEKADADSLCLFDELGAGTDPTEGAALATSILSFLHSMKIRTVATTHYSELKVYALSTPGVENACCEFDVETLRPTYRILSGVPGKSNAFAISKKLGLPSHIIENAKTYIEKNDAAFEDLLTKLETDRSTIEKERLQIDRYRKEIEQLKSRYEQQDETIETKKEKILSRAKKEAEQILAEAKETADDSIRRINRLTDDSGLMRALEKERSRIRENLKRVEKTERALKPASVKKPAAPPKLTLGDSVRVISMNHRAIVSSLPDRNGKLFVRMGILRTQVSLDDIVRIEEESGIGQQKSARGPLSSPSFSKAANISPEINLIGLTVDEAISELDKYLDDALLSHLGAVRVIHGRGTGALKKGIHAWLRKQGYIKSFKQAAYDDGGEAVTIVSFK